METARSDGAAGEPRVLAGKYRLDAQLRSGAMGAIYRAHNLTLDKTVCIKIMHPELARDEHFAMRFHREARAASRFDHPNSILVLDYGSDEDGTLYIAMELVEGRDLFDIIDEANASPGGVNAVFPPGRIVDLLSQTLAALAAAHDVGILHRDLKPENIMVASSCDDGERVKVCDFGIARIDDPDEPPAESGRRLTRRGFILGTPEYMSPEQARAEEVDARSDVYSAGMVLYHLLTGRVPFEDESQIAVALRQINEAPKRPSELVPHVHPGLEAICLKAIEKDPAKRYPSARAMRAALRDALALPHSTPLPVAPSTESLPPTDRLSSLPAVQLQSEPPRPRRSRGFAVAAALLVVASVGAVWKLRAPTASAAAKIEEPVAVLAPVPAARPAPVNVEPPKSEEPVIVTETKAAIPRKIAAAAARPSTPPRAPAPPAAPVEEPPPSAPQESPAPPPVEPEPAPVSPPPAPVATSPAYSLETARVELGAAQTVGATASSFERALAPVKVRLDACYRAALPKASAPEGTASLHLETDDMGTIRRAHVTGPLATEIGPCISKVVVGRKVANVDTGHASADVALAYRPR